jgi:hypothetical protein
VASCALCAARLRRLQLDLDQLRSALSESPPPQAATPPLQAVGGRWLTAAALAALLALVWFGVWWQQPAVPTLPLAVGQESIWPFLEGVSIALFPGIESEFTAMLEQLSDGGDLSAALLEELPCEGLEAVADVTCDDDMFALLLGEL